MADQDQKTLVTVSGMPGFWEVLKDLGDRVVVNRGPLQMEMPKSRIQTQGIAQAATVPKPPPARLDKVVEDRIDVHGHTVEQALKEIEAFLDDAKAEGHSQIQIIHGHGTGKLKSAICVWLKQNGYRFEGGHLSRRGFISQRVYLAKP